MTFLELFDAAALTVKLLCLLRTPVRGWCFKLNKTIQEGWFTGGFSFYLHQR